jgi:imidazolonepropionase-like amidohydrolase
MWFFTLIGMGLLLKLTVGRNKRMEKYLLDNGVLIDSTGRQPVEDHVLLIEGQSISKIVSKHSENSPLLHREGDINYIDLDGYYILPGFIDCHVHLMIPGQYDFQQIASSPFSLRFYQAINSMKNTLDAGITTVRDAGGMDLGVKQAIETGRVLGPRVQISVVGMTITGGHGDTWMPSGNRLDPFPPYPGMPDPRCDGVAEVRRTVREILRAGAEAVKIFATGGVMSPTDSPDFTQFSREELDIIVQEAEYHGGVRVLAHAQGRQGIRQAIEAGVGSIEHGNDLDAETARMMAKKDCFLVPTLSAAEWYLRDEKRMQNVPEAVIKKGLAVIERHKQSVSVAFEEGVKIAMGTDAGVIPHGSNLMELGLLNEMGLSARQALQAGTKVSAACLGWQNKIGTLEAGKLADIVVCKGNPLENIRLLEDPQNIVLVIKDGKIVKDIRKEA